MTLKFELSRLSLRDRMKSERKLEREEYIRRIFSNNYDFSHRGQAFYYRFDTRGDDNVIVARVGHEIRLADHLPPDKGLEESIRSTFAAALVFIDPSKHENGQLIAFEQDRDVGTASSILKSLIDHINQASADRSYVVQVSAVKDQETFWRFVKQHRGEITSVTFEFFVPNMFGGADKFSKTMRDLRDHENADKLTQTIKGQNLNLETERIKEAWGYVDKGQGTVKARAGKGGSYNSETESKVVTLPNITKKSTELLNSLVEIAKKVLGKS